MKRRLLLVAIAVFAASCGPLAALRRKSLFPETHATVYYSLIDGKAWELRSRGFTRTYDDLVKLNAKSQIDASLSAELIQLRTERQALSTALVQYTQTYNAFVEDPSSHTSENIEAAHLALFAQHYTFHVHAALLLGKAEMYFSEPFQSTMANWCERHDGRRTCFSGKRSSSKEVDAKIAELRSAEIRVIDEVFAKLRVDMQAAAKKKGYQEVIWGSNALFALRNTPEQAINKVFIPTSLYGMNPSGLDELKPGGNQRAWQNGWGTFLIGTKKFDTRTIFLPNPTPDAEDVITVKIRWPKNSFCKAKANSYARSLPLAPYVIRAVEPPSKKNSTFTFVCELENLANDQAAKQINDNYVHTCL